MSGEKNVGDIERVVSVLAGGSLLALGLARRTLGTGLLALAGVPLIVRGATGHCSGYAALGINTAGAAPGDGSRPEVLHGMNVVKSVIVNRSVNECYSMWHGYDKFPLFMDHLESVTPTGEKTSHWIACAPLGQSVEWDAEIVKTEKNRLIEWKSIEGSEVMHAGSVRFEEVDGGRRCKVTVTLRWSPPLGIAGFAVAKLLGEEPGAQIECDLERFKEVMETGEVPSA
jgi:uncharacterized membrane protein